MSLSVYIWNLNSLSNHNFSKLTQLKTYISMYKHDFTWLLGTCLDSSTHDGLWEVDGYSLVCAEHSNNIKRGGVCIYQESLPVQVISLPYLKEALQLEMTYNNEKVIVYVIQRSPSQNNSEFELLLSNFEKLLSNIIKSKPSLSVIKGDFSARSSSWWPKDITTEVPKLFSLTCSNGFL